MDYRDTHVQKIIKNFLDIEPKQAFSFYHYDGKIYRIPHVLGIKSAIDEVVDKNNYAIYAPSDINPFELNPSVYKKINQPDVVYVIKFKDDIYVDLNTVELKLNHYRKRLIPELTNFRFEVITDNIIITRDFN